MCPLYTRMPGTVSDSGNSKKNVINPKVTSFLMCLVQRTRASSEFLKKREAGNPYPTVTTLQICSSKFQDKRDLPGTMPLLTTWERKPRN